MSRRTEGKTARRRKRRAARDARWIPEFVPGELPAEYQIENFDSRITQRGWTFDSEFASETLVSWFFEPSGAEIADEDAEPVTRIWATAPGDGEPAGDEEFPNSVHVVLVGAADGHCFTPDELFDHIDIIEAYRTGDPTPVLS